MDLERDYVTAGDPAVASGITNLLRLYPYLDSKSLKDYLSSVEGYTLHRWSRRPRFYNNHYVRRRRRQMGIDLLDVSSIANENDGVKFLLVLIDNFSRLAFVRPLYRKTAVQVKRALKDIFDKELPPPLPRQLLSDSGGEFLNRIFQKYLDKNNISLVQAFSNKSSHIERFNRSLQKLIYQTRTHRDNERYIDDLQELLKSYNTRVHRMIGMSPLEADLPYNRNRVLTHLNRYWYKSESHSKSPKFKVGDLVRMKKSKTTFARGYDRIFTQDTLKVKKVYSKYAQPMYLLREYDVDEDLIGLFYEHEITLFKPPGHVFRIARLGGRRTNLAGVKEIQVFWSGFPQPTWEPVSVILGVRKKRRKRRR